MKTKSTTSAVEPMPTPLYPYRGMWPWLLPASVIGGMLSSAHTTNAAISLPKLSAGLALALGSWLLFWKALLDTNGSSLHTWQDWQTTAPLPPWPYLQPHTPGAALYHTLAQARAWWREQGREALGPTLRQALIAGISGLLLAWYLGRTALLLTLFLLAWAELSTLWHAGRDPLGSGWLAVAWVGLPWMLGGSLITLTPIVIGAAGVLTLVVACAACPSLWSIIGPMSATAFLLAQQHFVAAGIPLLLSLPGLNILLYHPSVTAYRTVLVPCLLAIILLFASVL